MSPEGTLCFRISWARRSILSSCSLPVNENRTRSTAVKWIEVTGPLGKGGPLGVDGLHEGRGSLGEDRDCCAGAAAAWAGSAEESKLGERPAGRR